MKIMPVYDLRKKDEVAILIKRLDENTIDSIEGLPDNMILILSETSSQTMTLQDLKEKTSGNRRIKNGVITDE